MKRDLKSSFVLIYISLSIILVSVVYIIYKHNINTIKREILREYLQVYIETRKDHIVDLVNHIINDITVRRKKLRSNLKTDMTTYIKIAVSTITHSKDKNDINIVKDINKQLKGKHIRLFIIDEKSKTFILKPPLIGDLDAKTLLKGGNSRFLSEYITYKPKGWIIGAVADYEKFENDLKKYVLNRLYHFRYGLRNEGYFFIVSIEKENGKIVTRRIMNPNKPKSSMNKIIPLNITDIKGKQFHREMVEKCLTKGQGFVKYYFRIIGTNKIAKKISFVKYYKPWHWMIGTGFYVTVFESELKGKNKTLNIILKKRNEKFLIALIVSFGFIVSVFIYITFVFLNKINSYIKRIEEADKFKQKIICMIPNPMFFTDNKGNILDCNEDFKELFDLKDTDKCGASEKENLKSLENKLKQILESFKRKGEEIPDNVEIELQIQEGENKIFNMYISNMQSKDRITGYVVILVDITESKETQEKLYNQSIKDELTDAFNRRYLRKLFPVEHEKAKNKSYKMSLVMFDIDFFKKINDTYGHDVGDKVLKKVVEIAEKHIRKGDLLFRIGGEEFVILLPGADKDTAYRIAEEIRKDIKSYKFEEGFSVTVSFGVAEVEEQDTLESILKKADKSLYKAKDSGRDRTVMYEG